LQETRKIASETDTMPSLKNGKRFEQHTTDGLAGRCEKDARGTPMHMRLSQKSVANNRLLHQTFPTGFRQQFQ
jgi:hypothetical protein